jgi:hypothetical protein
MQQLVSGCRARIQWLVGTPQHNGKEGVLVAFVQDTGRWDVVVGEQELLAVEPANLLFLSLPQAQAPSRQLQHRLDICAETSLLAARPLLLWAFQSSKKQLQAICGQRPSLFHAITAQKNAFGSLLGAKQRQSLLTCSRLCVTLAARLMC